MVGGTSVPQHISMAARARAARARSRVPRGPRRARACTGVLQPVARPRGRVRRPYEHGTRRCVPRGTQG